MNASNSAKKRSWTIGSAITAILLMLSLLPRIATIWSDWRDKADAKELYAAMVWLGFEDEYTLMDNRVSVPTTRVSFQVRLTDDYLGKIVGNRPRKEFDLTRTRITDAGLRHLTETPELEVLSLYGTEVTDAGLEHLRGLTNLKKLSLHETGVTREGVRRLQEALPDCEIRR